MALERDTLGVRKLEGEPLQLLDGAIGTELERRGVACGLPLWSCHALWTAPEVLLEIHRDYLTAGAQILTANTFRTQRRVIERARVAGFTQIQSAERLTALAVEIAQRALRDASHPVAIAGSLAPLEDCYRPDLVPGNAELRAEHRDQARNLAQAGVDCILVESMNTLREAREAADAAAETGLPFLVSFISWHRGRLLSGEDLTTAIEAVRGAGPEAVLVNCLPPSAVAACLPSLRDSGLCFGVYANLGAPEGPSSDPERSEQCDPPEFARHAEEWIRAGAGIVGGCCGTTPEHVSAIARMLESRSD